MYQVTIINNGTRKVIHYPVADNEAPHLQNMNLQLTENQSSMFSFIIYKTHASYDEIVDLVTKIEILDIKKNKLKFEGRVLISDEIMDSNGKFYKEVVCESELAYLNDSRVKMWALYPSTLPEDAPTYAEPNHTISTALQKIISNHNANTTADMHFTLGTIEITGGIYFTTNYETSLDIILKNLVNDRKAIVKIRKENGVRYLDILNDNPIVSSTKITLRKNLKEFRKKPNLDTFCTRAIGIGADGLSFSDINNGKDYVEDATAIAKYGIITKPFEFKDITIKENLLQKTEETLQDVLSLSSVCVEVTALELNCIGLAPEEFDISTKYTVENYVQNFSEDLKVIKIDLDLDKPWNSKLTFSDKPVTATANSIGIQQQVNNNRLEVLFYNGRLIQKVSSVDGKFESYREQTDQAISERVTSEEYESYKLQTAQEISERVTNGEFETFQVQNSQNIDFKISNSLKTTHYNFDVDAFRIGSTSNGDTAEHTNSYSKWIHGNNYSIAKAAGFFINNGGGERPIKSLNYMVIRPSIGNGSTTTIILPEDFQGKAINTDFTVIATHGDIDSSVGARFNKDAIRTIFVNVISWNSTTRELVVQPCLQKIGIVTETMWGWDSNTTTPGNTIGEGAIDVIVIASI